MITRNGRRSYSRTLGDGTARTFPVQHNLGTPALTEFTLCETGGTGRVFVRGRDYRVTIDNDNLLTVTLLAPRVAAAVPAGIATPAANGLRFTVLAAL